MRAYIRSAATALSIACLAAALAIVAADGALAQSKSAPAQAAPPQGQPPALKQIALTDKQVEGVVSKAKPRRWLRGFLVVVPCLRVSGVRALAFAKPAETSVSRISIGSGNPSR